MSPFKDKERRNAYFREYRKQRAKLFKEAMKALEKEKEKIEK